MRVFRKAICIPFAAALLTCASAFEASANDDLMNLASDAKNWAMPTGDYANTRYSKLNQINKDNVKDLQVKWTFSTGVLRGHEGGPLVIGDVMYVHTPFPNIVYALDLNNDGKILWKYEPKQDPNVISIMCCDTVNRGVAYGDGKIILHQADTTVVALDAKTGQVAWSVKNAETDGSKGKSGTSAPMVVKDKVIIGISGAEFGVRGHITGLQPQGRIACVAGLFDRPRCGDADRPRKDDASRQAGRSRFRHQHLGRRGVEDRWRHHLGMVLI